jgi:hypothetical protein
MPGDDLPTAVCLVLRDDFELHGMESAAALSAPSIAK